MATQVDFGILLGLAYQTFVDELRADLQARGFSDVGGAFGFVFRALDQEDLNLRQLAERLGMTDQGAAKIVNDMEAGEYLERYPDPLDGRVKKLRLARRGLAALAAARRFHQTYERRLAEKLQPADPVGLRRLLEAIVSNSGTEAARARLRSM